MLTPGTEAQAGSPLPPGKSLPGFLEPMGSPCHGPEAGEQRHDLATHVSLGALPPPPIFKELSLQSLQLESATIPDPDAAVGELLGWVGLSRAFILEECVAKLLSKGSTVILAFAGSRTWHQKDPSSDAT